MIDSLALLRWTTLAGVAGATGLIAYRVLLLPTRPTSRFGFRGLKRQRALNDPIWRHLEPGVRWLGNQLTRVLPARLTAAADRQLLLAGDFMGLSASDYFALSVLALGVGLFVGIVVSAELRLGAIFVVALAGFGATLPALYISGEAEKRLKWISRRLPTAIDLIALAMSAGLDFPGAIQQVVDKSGELDDPLIEELGWILHKLRLGTTRRQALVEFAARAPTEVVLEFAGAVSQAEERGHPVAQVLQVQAATSRDRRSVRAEESAAKAGVALAGPLILVFLGILLLIMAPMVLRLAQSPLLKD